MKHYPLKNWHTLKRGYTFGVPTFYSDFHLGLDIIVPEGTQIFAPEAGDVTTMEGSEGGLTVWLKTKKHLYRFLHLSELPKEGSVKAGAIIGKTGNTGQSSGPHVHIDISKGELRLGERENFIDPEAFFLQKTKTLKVKVLANKMAHWTTLEDKLQEVEKQFINKTDNALRFSFDVEHVTIDMSAAEWIERPFNNGGVKGKGKMIDEEFVRETFIPHARGYDICVYTQESQNWQSPGIGGYAEGADMARYGLEFIAMKAEENGVRRGGDEFTGRLIHELCHTITSMARIRDTVHDHDFASPTRWWKSINGRVQYDTLPETLEGKLVKSAQFPHIYLIEKGKRRHIQDELTFFLSTGKKMDHTGFDVVPFHHIIRYPQGKPITYAEQPQGLKNALVFTAKHPEYAKKLLGL